MEKMFLACGYTRVYRYHVTIHWLFSCTPRLLRNLHYPHPFIAIFVFTRSDPTTYALSTSRNKLRGFGGKYNRNELRRMTQEPKHRGGILGSALLSTIFTSRQLTLATFYWYGRLSGRNPLTYAVEICPIVLPLVDSCQFIYSLVSILKHPSPPVIRPR